MILRSRLRLIAGAAAGAAAAAAALLPASSDAFTAESFVVVGTTRRRAGTTTSPSSRVARRSAPVGRDGQRNDDGPSPEFFRKMGLAEGQPPPQERRPQQQQQQPPPPPPPPPQQQRYFDASGNPVSAPMVYDASGNLVPFNPGAMRAPPQQQAIVVEPPLPPKTKGDDVPRPVGFNPDAHAMSNTADVYFAQLKQDSKVRKLARMSGDVETANRVFADDSVREIGESWNENPYTREANHAEARAQIEGAVITQIQESVAPEMSSGIRYRQKLEEMKRKRSGGTGSAPETPVVEQPVQSAQPVRSAPPHPVAEAKATEPVQPPPVLVTAPTDAVAPAARTQPSVPTAVNPDPVASVEAALEAYKNAPPEEREGMVAMLREAMMAASGAGAVTAPAAPVAEAAPIVPVAEAAPIVPIAEAPPVPQANAPATTEPDEQVAPVSPAGTQEDLALAAVKMDAAAVSALVASGVEMDEATADAAFRAVVNAVDRAEALDQPLSGDVPAMLHHVFDADMKHLLTREKETTNVTCMMPEQAGANRIGMNYIFDDSAHKDLPLEPGRRCEGGTCCDKCSRNIFPTFASHAETDFDTYPELTALTFNELADVSAATILQFTRLIERVRRTIAHEYGLPLKTILPLQAYSRKYVAGTTQKGGGGGEGDFVTLHTDEATHDGYHYSCVLYLSTQGEDFEGGNFVFNDPDPNAKPRKAAYFDDPDPEVRKMRALEEAAAAEDDDEDEDVEYASLADRIRREGRVFTPYSPSRGAAVIFSSGWENMHEVETITSGTRYCVPCFFTTCPVPDAAYEQMAVGKPKTNEDMADDWLHLLLAHRKEEAHESLGRVKELLMKWHYICTPLGEH